MGCLSVGRGARVAAVAAVVAGGLAMVPATAYASTAAAAAKPAAPKHVTAAARDHGALVSWIKPGGTVTAYVITAEPGGATVRTSEVTRFLVGGLANGRQYRFTVRAVNAAGTGPASAASAAVTPQAPSAPGSVGRLRVLAGFGQVAVSWAMPSSDGGAPLTGFRVSTSPATATLTVSAATTTATVTGLKDGTSYRVAVTAVNSAGAAKVAWSAAVRPGMTVPDAPASVTAAPTANGVTISWTAPLSDGGSAVTGYVIAVAGTTEKVSAGAAATSATITGLTAGKGYTFTVAARNAKGTGLVAKSTAATAGATVAAHTVVLSAASVAALSTVGTNGTLTFISPPAQVTSLADGDIIVAGTSTATPAGLLAEVRSVATSGSTVTVATAPASLDQALTAAGFGTTATLTRGQVASFTPAVAGVRLMTAAQERAAGLSLGTISVILDADLYKSANGKQVSVAGTISLTPAIDFSASISCCVHTASQFTGTITAAAALSFSAQVNHAVSGGITLGEIHFAPITVAVAGVPVVIVPDLTIKLDASGTVTAGVTAGASASVTIGAKVTTKDAHVSASPVFSHTLSFTPPVLYGSMTVEAGPEADLSTTVDGLHGPGLDDALSLAKLTASTTADPWWTLDARNELDLDYDLKLLDHVFVSYHATLSDLTLHLSDAGCPYQDVVISPAPAVVAPRGRLQLHAQVAGLAAQNVTWGAPSGDGSITSGGLYTAPSKPGIYEVTAAQKAAGLSPGATGITSIRVGANPPGAPASPVATSTSYGTAQVSWQPPSDDGGAPVTGYTVTAEPGGATYPAGGASTTIGGLTPGNTYMFTVTATNSGGTSPLSASTAPVTIDNVPMNALHWTPAQAPLPANAAAVPYASLDFVACPSVTSCVAVGQYQDSSGNYQGLLVTRSGTSWMATEAPMPADAATNPDPIPFSISCSSPSACVAVGEYTASSGASKGLVLSGAGSSWTATASPLPANGLPTAGSVLQSVSCAPGGECVAGGHYTTTSVETEGLLLTGSGSSWTPAQAPLPADAASNPLAAVTAVSCPAASACTAAGYYNDTAGDGQSVLLSGAGTSWTAIQAQGPADAVIGAGSYVSLFSLSCPSAGQCVAAGIYNSASGDRGLLESGSGRSWTPIAVPRPANEVSNDGGILLDSVTCSPAAVCVATGGYNGTTAPEGMLVSGWGSSWTTSEVPLPANATSWGQYVGQNTASCPSAAECVAVGYYVNGSVNSGLLLSGSGSSWSPTQAPQLPNANLFPDNGLESVACPSANFCVAVGAESTSSGASEGLLETGAA